MITKEWRWPEEKKPHSHVEEKDFYADVEGMSSLTRRGSMGREGDEGFSATAFGDLFG